MVIRVEEAGSGEDDHTLWVSLGFQSELSEQDVLFIVCGKQIAEQERREEYDGLYFERWDQAYSGYDLAESIIIRPTTVEIGWSKDGSKELEWPRSVQFDCSSVGNWAEIQKMLQRMREYPWAAAITVAE
jgi:hypothetical protein